MRNSAAVQPLAWPPGEAKSGAGGLMNYGDSVDDAWRRCAMQVDRVLAKALGLTIPTSLLQRADQVVG